MRVFLTTAIAVLVLWSLYFAPVKSNRVRNRPNRAVDRTVVGCRPPQPITASIRPQNGVQMTVQYKADFDKLEWESPIEGVRHKYIDQNNLRVRLVEYSKEMPPHWCEKGHYGYLIEGQMEIEYENSRIVYEPR